MEKENSNQQQIPWDKINCSYWWHFVTDLNHPKWFGNIKEGNGYSKKQGQNEAKDKNHLLISKIVMLCKNEYIQSCEKIQIYKRPMIRVTYLTNDPLLITYSNRGKEIDYTSYFYTTFPKDTIQHILTIGEMLQHGRADEIKYYLPRKKQYDEIPLNERSPNFLTPAHLYNWAEHQIKNGKDFKMTSVFVAEYMKKNFPEESKK